MLERIRQSRRLHAVVVTAFALLLLVAMLSGVRVRAATAPATHETLTQSMLHSLCLPQDAPAAAASQQQAYEEWLLSAFDTPPATHAHDEHAGPHCVLCLALMLPPAIRLQAAPIRCRTTAHRGCGRCCFRLHSLSGHHFRPEALRPVSAFSEKSSRTRHWVRTVL